MNKNPIVSLQVAQSAKEKGYEGKGCKNFWYSHHADAESFHCASKNGMYNGREKEFNSLFANHFPAPDRESLQRWLRKKHNIRAHVSDEGLLKGLQQIPQ